MFRGTVTEACARWAGAKDARTDIRFTVDAVYKGRVYQRSGGRVATGPGGLRSDPGVEHDLDHLRGRQHRGRGRRGGRAADHHICAAGTCPPGALPRVLGLPRDPLPGSSDREERATGDGPHGSPAAWRSPASPLLFVTAVAVRRPGRALASGPKACEASAARSAARRARSWSSPRSGRSRPVRTHAPAPRPPTSRYVSSADVIFTGRIDDDRSDQQTRTITFAVERSLQG